jgi:predicted nucleotide-binding protein
MNKSSIVDKISKKRAASDQPRGTKKYLSQVDVPSYALEQSARVPRAILDEHAGKPTKPLDVAQAMKVQPNSGPFRLLCGAAIAYGLTEGGCNADSIVVTDLGRRVVTKSIDDPEGLAARREAVLKPRVLREFLQKYDGAKMPREDVALRVLEALQVPGDALKRAFDLISEAASTARFFKEINGVQYVDLRNASTVVAPLKAVDELSDGSSAGEKEVGALAGTERKERASGSPPLSGQPDPREKRVFVTHGKNREFLPQIKELLEFGQFDPVVSVERESVSKPIPDKVMDDMRSCGAAIIHVDADREVITQEGEKEVVLNGNVLIEIGGAMALYGRRFILLVKEGIRLPSNLQGLYEVRYSGDKLDGDATLRLLKAFNEFKSIPVAKFNP